MNSNKSYLKFADGVAVFGPVPLVWSKHHVETYPEEVVNEDTGEVSQTGNMLTSEWDEGPRRLAHPTAEQYADMGYLPVSDRVPSETPGDGNEWKAKGSGISEDDWELVDGDHPYWKRVYEEIAIVAPESAPRVFSRMNLEFALFNQGLLDRFDAFIDSESIENEYGQTMPLRRAYDRANDLKENNKLFVPYLEKAKAYLGVDDETVEAILAASVMEA